MYIYKVQVKYITNLTSSREIIYFIKNLIQFFAIDVNNCEKRIASVFTLNVYDAEIKSLKYHSKFH